MDKIVKELLSEEGQKRSKEGKREEASTSSEELERGKRKQRRREDSSSSEEEKQKSEKRKKRRSRKEDSSSLSDSDSVDERRRHRKGKKRRKKKESSGESSSEDDRRRRKEKKVRDSKVIEREEKKRKKERKKEKRKKLKAGAVTDRYGKYGIIRDSDMWNKRPEFGAWLHEVKHIDLETLPNREEKELFKDFMEDYNTATLPSKKYYNMELYHRNKMAKAHAKGVQLVQAEKVVFDDEAEKRVELQRQRDQQKEADYQAYKASMVAGMAEDMREQEHLRNEMQYQYRLGNTEAVDTIKRRLAPIEEPNTVVQ